MTSHLQFAPDVLPGYEAAPVAQGTLVRRVAQPAAPRGAVLHLHGHNDYFFQTHLADALAEAGYAFFAVDVRRCGRSLREGDLPHYFDDISEQGEDLAAAIDAVGTLMPDAPLAVHAHSTGGLAAAVHLASQGTAPVRALVLDSPWFGSPATWRTRISPAVLPIIARRDPHAIVSEGRSLNATRLLDLNGGPWHFDPAWKRPEGVPARAAWLLAVARAQRTVARGLDLDIPVLAARAAAGGPESLDNPDHMRQDTVVDVRAISRLAPRLGPHAEVLVVPDGIHDLCLSDDAPRRLYLDAVTAFLDRALAPGARP